MKSKSPSTVPIQLRPRVVINDSACLIDLRKAALITEMLRLPYRFLVAYPLRQNNLLDIHDREWTSFIAAGMEVIDLDGMQVSQALSMSSRHAGLSAEDCFSLVLATEVAGSILLSDDAQLRKVTDSMKIEVHGILWVVEQLLVTGTLNAAQLGICLKVWKEDATVFLQSRLIAALIEKCA